MERLADLNLYVINNVNLDAVTVATNEVAVDTRWYKDKSVFIEVTGNTGAVTVNIEGSPDGITWGYGLIWTKTYAAANGKDSKSTADHFPYMRTTTTTQSNATVTTIITGRS